MRTFHYEAAGRDGTIERGTVEAVSTASLERELASRGLYPIELSVKDSPRRRAGFTGSGRRDRKRDAISALRYLASLLEVGTPLDRALEAAGETSRTAEVADALEGVRKKVQRGEALAEAIAEHPRVFPRSAAAIVAAGERSGHLDRGIRNGVALAERENALKVRILTNMAYPAVVLVVAIVVVLLLVGFVLPRFAELFRDAGSQLPASTRILLAGSRLIGGWWPLWAALGVAAGVGVALHLRTPAGRRRVERVMAGLPLLGSLFRQYTAIRVGSSLGPALTTGVPLSRAIGFVVESLRDGIVADGLRRCLLDVRKGRDFAEALRGTHLFPERFLRMVEMGEDSGRLAELMERAVETTEQDLTRRLEVLVRLIEPAMIIMLGAGLGFVALALLQALYRFQAVPL